MTLSKSCLSSFAALFTRIEIGPISFFTFSNELLSCSIFFKSHFTNKLSTSYLFLIFFDNSEILSLNFSFNILPPTLEAPPANQRFPNR